MKPEPKIWTDARVATFMRLLDAGRSNEQIADEMGLPLSQIQYKQQHITVRMMLLARAAANTKLRRCLKCRNSFVSDGAGDRLCGPCGNWVSDQRADVWGCSL